MSADFAPNLAEAGKIRPEVGPSFAFRTMLDGCRPSSANHRPTFAQTMLNGIRPISADIRKACPDFDTCSGTNLRKNVYGVT